MSTSLRFAPSRFLSTALVFALAVLGFSSSALAQQRPAKVPGGPYVNSSGAGDPTIEAGRTITWTVTVNVFAPNIIDFYDSPASNAPYGVECGTETAPGRTQTYVDTNSDGNCAETVLDISGGSGYTITCDTASNTLLIENINVTPPSVTITYMTTIEDDPTTYGSTVCNQAHFLNSTTGAFLQSTTAPGSTVPSCSCLRIVPPSGFDMILEKTAVMDNGRLVPGDPASTVTYTIRAVNTGSEDITAGQLVDDLPEGAEWVQPAVSCPPPLTCTFSDSDPRPPTVINRLTVSGYNLLSEDPDAEITIVAQALVTCDAATDDDSYELCNQGNFTAGLAQFPSDDPAVGGPSDPTCLPVVWSNLTTTRKIYDHFDDANSNGQLDMGERVHFIIQARNDGRLLATNVVVTDEPGATGCFDPLSVQAQDGGTVLAGVATWNIGNLAANGGQTNVRVSAVLSLDQICCNQAEVNSDERVGCGQDPIPSNDPSTGAAGDPTCVSPGPQPKLEFDKEVILETDADGSGGITAGDTLRWRITIENIGAGAATGADLNDPLPLCLSGFNGSLPVFTTTDGADAGTNNSVPSAGPPAPGSVIVNNLGGANGIQPGETIVIEFLSGTRTINNCCNSAEISYAEAVEPIPSDDPNTPGIVDDSTCLVIAAPGPAGQLGKTNRLLDSNGDGFLGVGERVEYTLTFTNIGTEPLAAVNIQDLSQPCITFDISTLTITTAPGSFPVTNGSSGNTITATIPNILPTESVTLVFEGVINSIGSCCNQATYSATGGGGTAINGLSDLDVANFTPDEPTCHTADDIPSDTINMSIVKTIAESGCQDPGAMVNYTIRVSSTGTDPVGSYTMEDVLDGTMFGDLPIAPLPLQVTMADRTGDGTEDYVVSVTDNVPLAPGASKTYSYQVQLGCTDSGTATNDASVTFTGSTGASQTRTDSVTITWGVPSLTTTKTRTWLDIDADGFLDLNETLSYTITVANQLTASCAARDVTVTDALDASLDGATVVPQDGGTYDGGSNSVIWDSAGTPALTSIAPGAAVVLHFDVRLRSSATIGATVANTAIASPKNVIGGNCPTRDLSASGSSATVQYDPGGTVASVTLLRNDFISCRLTAFATMRAGTPVLQLGAPGPCSNPPSINRLHPQTDAIATPANPYVATGDATPGTDSCPQIGAGDGRVLIFYELEESDCTGAIPEIRLSKQGNDVRIIW